MLRVLRLFALPFTLLSSCFHSSHTAYTHLVHQTEASIVRITGEKDVESFFGEGRVDYVCSGWVIAQDRVLTAGHCAGDKMRADGEEATVLQADSYYDLALLDVATEDKPTLAIAAQPPAEYSVLVALGYAEGWTRITALDQKLVLVDYPPAPQLAPGLLMAPGFIGGMSGGPIVNLNGEVVGVVQRTGDQIGYGIGVTLIRGFLVGTELQ